jgi:hypothetical protein
MDRDLDRKLFMIDSCSDLSENQLYYIQKILAQKLFELFDLKFRISTSVEQNIFDFHEI